MCPNDGRTFTAVLLFFALPAFLMMTSSCTFYSVEHAKRNPYSEYKQVGGEHGVCRDLKATGCEDIPDSYSSYR